MNNTNNLSEELLDSWLNLSMNLWNERLVSFMSYNEALVCHLLYHKYTHFPEDPFMTLMQLSAQTNILKSQMNKTITALESQGFVIRQRSKKDKRIIYISINVENLDLYMKEHINVLHTTDSIIEGLGQEQTLQAINIFNAITNTIKNLPKKGN